MFTLFPGSSHLEALVVSHNRIAFLSPTAFANLDKEQRPLPRALRASQICSCVLCGLRVQWRGVNRQEGLGRL